MEISFHTKIGLEFAVIVFGVLSIVYSYLGVIIGAIGVILLYHEIKTHGAERADFREKLANDAVSYMEQFLSRPTNSHPPLVVWTSKNEQFKSDALGREVYELWKKFYDCIEARERYLGSRSGFDQEIGRLNKACYGNFLEVCDKASWVRELQQTRIDDLIARRKEVSLL